MIGEPVEKYLPLVIGNDSHADADFTSALVLGQATEGGVRIVGRLAFPTQPARGPEHTLDRPLVGASDSAGEIGHVRMAPGGAVGYGKAGSFEGFCSGSGISRLAAQEVRAAWSRGETVGSWAGEEELRLLDVQRLAEAARAGDTIAKRVFATSGRHLGYGLAILIDVLNPQAIVIGSIFGRCTDLLWAPASQVLRDEALPAAPACCQVVPAALGESIGDYAALAAARHGWRGSA